jgi:hypothetical protein
LKGSSQSVDPLDHLQPNMHSLVNDLTLGATLTGKQSTPSGSHTLTPLSLSSPYSLLFDWSREHETFLLMLAVKFFFLIACKILPPFSLLSLPVFVCSPAKMHAFRSLKLLLLVLVPLPGPRGQAPPPPLPQPSLAAVTPDPLLLLVTSITRWMGEEMFQT